MSKDYLLTTRVFYSLFLFLLFLLYPAEPYQHKHRTWCLQVLLCGPAAIPAATPSFIVGLIEWLFHCKWYKQYKQFI